MDFDVNEHYIDQELYKNQPLLTRGWVVQERLLAPRVLHFGETQIFWECNEITCSESYPSGVPIHSERLRERDPPLKMQNPGAAALANRETMGMTRDFRVSVYDFWEKAVKMYTRCKLTKGSDKLVAIGGIAWELNLYLGNKDEYLAGVWRNDVFAQLSWYTHKRSWEPKPEQYRAPSWSWANVDGPVSFLSNRYLTYWRDFSNTLVSADVDYSIGDGFGQVTGGIIRITGPLKTVTCTHNPHPDYQDPEFRIDLRTSHPYEHGPTNSAPSVYWDFPKISEVSSFVKENKEDLRLHWMPFFPKDANTKTADVYGLILQPTGLTKGQFRRLGVLNVMGPQLDSMMDVSRLADADPQDSWLEYEEFDGTTYTISII
jgi:hypothetical protein